MSDTSGAPEIRIAIDRPFEIEVLTRAVHERAIVELLTGIARSRDEMAELCELWREAPLSVWSEEQINTSLRHWDYHADDAASAARAILAHRWALTQVVD